MRVALIGAVEFSFSMLEELLSKKVEVVGVITRKSKSAHDDFVDLTPLCNADLISIHHTDNINSTVTISFLKSLECDVVFCCGWSGLLHSEILGVPRHGVIGYHPSALPKNRGRHPIIWALTLGLTETASTFFCMDEGADSGDIISQRVISIDPEDDARLLYDKLTSAGRVQIIEIINQLKLDKLKRKKQNHLEATYWRKRNYSDGQIDWRMSAQTIFDLVRALSSPYCGAHFKFRGRDITVKSCKVVFITEANCREPGFVLKVKSSSKFVVKCGVDCLEVESLKPFKIFAPGEYL